MAAQQEKPYRRLIIFSALQTADEDILGRGLILYIVDNTSTKRVITPKLLSSKCNMYWNKIERETGSKMATPTKAKRQKIFNNLKFALDLVLSKNHFYRKMRTEQLEAKLDGWRKSEERRRSEEKKRRRKS